jgi:hypothetical protein
MKSTKHHALECLIIAGILTMVIFGIQAGLSIGQ